MIPSQ